MEKETAKVNKASTARFQGRATPGTAVHDYTLSDWTDLHFSGHGGIRKLASGIRKLEVVFGNWKVVFRNWTVVFGN